MWLYSPHSSEPVTADPLSKAALRADGSSLELAPGIMSTAAHCTVCACLTVDLLALALRTRKQAVGVSSALVFCICLYSSARLPLKCGPLRS